MKRKTVKRFFKKCKKENFSDNECMDALFRNKFTTKKIRELYKLYFAKEKKYKLLNFCKKTKKNKR